ncbi:MAG TPA: hypothetical protein VK831_05480, partial [Candidatus Deferrimicrobiaceae bacterium]|nr:hypothetical protein [Candidatus Deferrimicrobiaceae bacterium]
MCIDAPAPLRRAALALLLVVVIGVPAYILLGSHASAILSNVGASIGDVGAGHGDAGQGAQAAPPVRQDNPPQATDATVYSIDRPDLLIIKTGSISIRVV